MIGERLQVGGVVLCGGQSRRMGTAKSWLSLGGETLLQRVVRLLGEVVRPVAVVAAADQEVPGLPDDVLLVRDTVPGLGPLQGLCDGLESLSGRSDAVFVSSCDAPFLRPAFVTRMIELLGDCDICVVRALGFYHPLAAVYRLTVLPAVKKLLAANERRLWSLFEELSTRIVAAAELADVDPDLQSLRNLNTPADYEEAFLSWRQVSQAVDVRGNR